MKQHLIMVAALSALTLGLSACEQGSSAPAPSDNLTKARESAAAEAQSAVTQSYEIDNVKKRRLLFGKPGVIGYVAFFGGMGQPVQYLTVMGKCTSSNKRLTSGEEIQDAGYSHYVVMKAPAEDGTYGSSDEYIYCFTTNGTYAQWNGLYLFSNKPFELTTPPMVISVQNRDDHRTQGQ